MRENFQPSLKLVLKSEGGNSDDPVDRGGRTSRGITQARYNAWRRQNNLPIRDVWLATDKEVANIYYQYYWIPSGNTLPKGIDYLYFNMAVNAGPKQAAILLQRALGVEQDGKIGPLTRQAISDVGARKLVGLYTGVSARFYRSIVANNPSQKRFLKGWINRALRVEKDALRMLNV